MINQVKSIDYRQIFYNNLSMYKYTRQEAADILWVSTRSIDRYIKSWKIRSKKDWKVVYVKWSDIDILSWDSSINQEIIVEKNYSPKNPINNFESTKEIEIESKINKNVLDEVYSDLRNEIKEKDIIIRELSIRVWKAEEIAKNSVSLIDFKKSQFLLEESKSSLNNTLEELSNDKEKLTSELKYQKTNNIILIIALIVLFAIAWTIFILKI